MNGGMSINEFKRSIWSHYRTHGRHALLWRKPAHVHDPYRIFVSEVMLQQTQVSRVEVKYPQFIKQFPTFRALARARTSEVLRAWQGMGYNRRALNLKRAAEVVVREYRGALPRDPALLYALPGIGAATAGSIAAFAFNAPIPFIETNIRRVFIHFFFPRAKKVRDETIMALVRKTLDTENPREWYYALMDYGTHLARIAPKNPNRKSARYRKQPAFKGSRRALRGAILKSLLKEGAMNGAALAHVLQEPRERVESVLEELCAEKFIVKGRKGFSIAE